MLEVFSTCDRSRIACQFLFLRKAVLALAFVTDIRHRNKLVSKYGLLVNGVLDS
jgi:hypothetical protein